jgi:hypothetical protein
MKTILSTYAYHPSDEQKPDLKVATDIIAKYEVAPVPHTRAIDPRLEWDIKQNGILVPLKIYTNGVIATLGDGNHRIRIAKKLGIKKVPVIFIPDNFRRLHTLTSGSPLLHPILAAWVKDHLWAHEGHEVTRNFIGGGMRGGIAANRFMRCNCSCGATWKEEG